MDLSSATTQYSPLFVGAVLFCLLWPIIAFFLMRRGTASPAPWMAIFVAIGASATAMWMSIGEVARAMAVSGSGGRAAVAAGRAESLGLLLAGALSAVLVAAAALIRRHRPTAGPGTIVLAAVLMLSVLGATTEDPMSIVRGGLLLAAVVMVTAFALLVRLARGRGIGRPLPYASVGITAALLLLAGGVYHCFGVLRQIAITG